MSHTFSYPQYLKRYQKCRQCLKAMAGDKLLREDLCGSVFCPRCLCQIYQPHYLEPERDIIIELYCGHYVDRIVIEQFILDHCLNCGNAYDPRTDLEMKDSLKLCRPCFDRNLGKYRNHVLECMSCGRFIRSASFLAQSEVTICRDCATEQSEIHSTISNHFSQSQATNKTELPKPIPPVQQEPLSSRSQSQKLSKKQSSQQLPSEDISIVSRFSALEIEGQGEGTTKNMMKLASKHSIDIRVENLKIGIELVPTKGRRCDLCRCFVPEQSIMQADNQEAFNCRVCFMESFDPRETAFSRSFARSSEQNDRGKHNSAPKRKVLAPEQVRTMRKSLVVGDSDQKPNVQWWESPKVVKWWERPLAQEKLCQICKKKPFMVTKSNSLKVCIDCSNLA